MKIRLCYLVALFAAVTGMLLTACSSSSGGSSAKDAGGTLDSGGGDDGGDAQVPWPDGGGTFDGTADPVGMVSATITAMPIFLTTSSGLEFTAHLQPTGPRDGTITFSAPAGVSGGSLTGGINILVTPAAGTYTPGNSKADIRLGFNYPNGIEGLAASTGLNVDGGTCGDWTLVLTSVTQVGSSSDYIAHGTLMATLALCLPGVQGTGTLNITF